jgi:GPH family glycoside/pentoside/hexuronide:cation symporter
VAAVTNLGATAVVPEPATTVSASGLLAYSLFALPLTMMALPVYVLVPAFYASATGLALSTIGAVLLATRVLDAIVDPLLGAWVDRSRGAYLRPLTLALPVLACGFALLFLPPTGMSTVGAAGWLAATLVAATLGYSLATIAYQAWGARLANDDAGRARVTGWREGFGLIGVILASLLSTGGAASLVALFLGSLAVASLALLTRAPRTAPVTAVPTLSPWRALATPLAERRFRWLLAIFVANGIAAAVPASLVMFFIADRLQLASQSGVLLALYFLSAACSMVLWTRLARRWSLQSVWLAGMLLAVAAFVWAYGLGAGDFTAFAVICALSGAALGADLALPPALLARAIALSGHSGQHEGSYFGLWNFANKLNLALAAGLALPVLDALGYTPGARDPAALEALAFAYAVLPCALKLAAAALLLVAWRGHRFQEPPKP